MGKLYVLVWLLILGLDVVAGVLGIQAEIAKNDVRDMKVGTSYCKEPREKTGLGLGALFLLVVAHITANLFSAWMCLSSIQDWELLSSSHRKMWFACFVLSWIIAAVGFSVLIIGVLQSSRSEGTCKILDDYHFLLIGSASCFMHGLFCVGMYIVVTISTTTTTAATTQHQRDHP